MSRLIFIILVWAVTSPLWERAWSQLFVRGAPPAGGRGRWRAAPPPGRARPPPEGPPAERGCPGWGWLRRQPTTGPGPSRLTGRNPSPHTRSLSPPPHSPLGSGSGWAVTPPTPPSLSDCCRSTVCPTPSNFSAKCLMMQNLYEASRLFSPPESFAARTDTFRLHSRFLQPFNASGHH